MGWFDKGSSQADAYNTVTGAAHKSSVTHELLAAAASYEAAKKYEEHVAANGKPVSHAKAKELVAAFSGAFVDHVVETKGLDFVDREKAKHDAKKHSEEALAGCGDY